MKLRIILVVLSLLAFLSVSIAGYIYYSSLKESAFREAEKEIAVQAEKTKESLSSYLSENLKTVKALAGLKEMERSLADRGERSAGRRHAGVPKVSDRVATAAYRIAQEALTNVARHSKASRVDVSLRAEGEILTLSVEDDGRGFDLRELPESVGLGVVGMRERAELIGGTLEIRSRPGEGTRVHLKVPVDGAGEVLH